MERRLLAAVTQGHISPGPQQSLNHLFKTPGGETKHDTKK